jgi:pimeloyl-ACP methyl ester carboxylesterase
MNIELLKWKEEGSYFKYNRHKVFYQQKGKGENLLILHGYPYNSYEWKETITQLSKDYTVTIFDFMGMGFSDKPQNYHYCYADYCQLVSEILSFLNIEETHILSHDLGVSVAQELLALNAENKLHFQIQSISFVNGGLFMDTYKPRFLQRLLSQTPDFIGKFVSKKISKASVNKSVKSVFGEFTQPTEHFLDIQWEILNYKNGKEINYLIGRLVFEKYKHQKRWISAMQKTKIPLCYICGPADPNSGIKMAERYKELIPNPTIYLLNKDIGHWPMLEDQKGFIKDLIIFLKKK